MGWSDANFHFDSCSFISILKRMQGNSPNNKEHYNLEPLLSKHNPVTVNCEGDDVVRTERGIAGKHSKNIVEFHPTRKKPPTTSLETLIHMVKGNLGGGAFAMGDAVKNAGLLLGPILIVLIGIICVYSNHLLVNCSNAIRNKKKLASSPDFPETVELCFQNGPPSFQKWAPIVRRSVKVFITITQLGFCCVYFVFVSSTAQTVLKAYNIHYDVRVYMAIMFVPVLLTCFIRTLKFLTPISLISNACLISGIIFTVYLSCSDLPPITSRKMFASMDTLPLFFGTVVYSFEGISLIMPLKNEMREQEKFSKPFGPLNLGMLIIMAILLSLGFVGYWSYGEDVLGSLSLNLPSENKFTNTVQIVVAIGIIFSYALQFYVAADLLWMELEESCGPFKHPLFMELLLRAVLVTFTFVMAAVIPQLGLFISLVGALSSTALALLYPPLCDIALRTCAVDERPLSPNHQVFRFAMDGITLLTAGFGFTFGTYYSLAAIINEFIK